MSGTTMHEGAEMPNHLVFERHMTASRKRIMFTHWLGEAYRRFSSSKYKQLRVRAFEKGGCTAGSSNFDASKVEVLGLKRPFRLHENGAELLSDAYRNEHFSGFANFNFRLDAAENDEEDNESSSSSSSSSSSESDDHAAPAAVAAPAAAAEPDVAFVAFESAV